MDKAAGSNWYFREGGSVASAAWSVTDAGPMLRANAYRKTVTGEDLTDAESEAVEAAKGLTLMGSVAGGWIGDMELGFMFGQAPELVAELDALVARWAERMGAPEYMAWQAAADYTERALGVTLEEAGVGSEEAALARYAATESPERIAEIKARWDADRTAFEELMASPEEQARQAAVEAAMVPDGGPEGWSLEPPTNPAHPILAGRPK